MAKKEQAKRLKRSESFLGIHFDFHAGDDCTQIGRNVTRKMVENIIDKVQPDYVQCDCKGHRGLSSYPTKAGNPAPGFVRDQLKIWRQVTAERGVALFMHYSGVWDSEAVRQHPSWARVDENGKRDKNATSVFGPYVDKLLIPQLKELSDVYGVDGIWCDGECWATKPDWSRRAIAAFQKETGITDIPRSPEDKHYFEYLQFCREAFRRYLDHYVTALHEHNPDFQIASNWAYSSFMPEPVTVDVDYISGDYPMQNSVNVARLEARCMARQGKPWDLMAWSFAGKWGERPYSTKTAVQLQQEAAVVLSVGGGFQAYFKQDRDGSIYDWTMNVMAEVAKFCRARQAVCHRAEAVPQVGLIYSGTAHYRKATNLFAPWAGELTPMNGVLRALLESQYSTEVLMEHHLEGRMAEYPLLVVPEWDYLPAKFKRELRDYVGGGGNLLLIGPAAAAMFRKELGVSFRGPAQEKAQYLEHNGVMAGVRSTWRRAVPGRSAKVIGRLYPKDKPEGKPEVAASVARFGKGRIAATYLNLGEAYVNSKTALFRDFIATLVRELFPEPMVEVQGSHFVDVAVNRINGKLAINLVNTAGPHHDPNIYTFDEVPPVGPLAITIRLPKRPKRITVEPAGTDIAYRFSNGAVRLELPRLEIHDIVVVEQ